MKSFATSIAATVVVSASTVLAGLPPVTVKGNAFFAGNDRFYIRGVDYQPGGSAGAGTKSGFMDPLADPAVCKRDLQYFKKLGVNTVRVYIVDNTANHDECMAAFDEAGIYLAIDVNTPDYALNRNDPKASYNNVYLQSVFATIDNFAKYDNTLVFFSGNEVINTPGNSDTAPYIKAVVRDMKQYIGSMGHRQIPVGYSAADVSQNREQTALYLNCGTDDARSDFFSFNDYSWCDPSNFQKSGWAEKVQTYKDYSIPLFLSEYGCITNTRKFQEVKALYSSKMTPVYSGGLVYEYSEEGDGYGLVTISGSGQVHPEVDFTYLEKAFNDTPMPSGTGGYHTNEPPSQCPPAGQYWDVHTTLLPAIPAPAEKYMSQGAGRGPGFTGNSMEAGTPSKGWAKPGSGKVVSVAHNPNVGPTSTGSGSGSGSGSSSSGSSGANAALRAPDMTVAPFICALVALASTLFGASLL